MQSGNMSSAISSFAGAKALAKLGFEASLRVHHPIASGLALAVKGP